MVEKYCKGNARLAERVFGWNRHTVETGLGERRTGILCLSAKSVFSGKPRWEEKQPDAAYALCKIAEEYAQQDPTFKSTIRYTRLTISQALKQLSEQGFKKEQLPSKTTMAEVLNRMGYRLRKVVKAKPQKKIPQTDDIFDNIHHKDAESKLKPNVKRLSIDCKATINLGEYSRRGSNFRR